MFAIVVGGGKIGMRVASLLLNEGHEVKVVEMRPDVLERLRDEIPLESIVAGDGTDPHLLEVNDIRQAQVVAALTGEDEANLVVAMLARFEFRVPRVIARINNPKNAWVFTPAMGVDAALNQADILGKLILEEMSSGEMMTLLKLKRGEYSIIEEKVHPASMAAGRAVRDLDFPAESTLIAVLREGELIVPHGNTVLQPGDEVLAIVHHSGLSKLAALLEHHS
ncbi:MAG: TrkA family potassium uptake protein [Chloroflexi bacterium]|nr:TrkA family potassium uptake protein [Chloroflexota bacterium]